MANSRIPIGVTVAIIGASLAMSGPVLAADPTPLIPPATSPPAAIAIPLAPPAHKVPVAAKHTPAPAHAQTQPLIPPAILSGPSSQLGPPPAPREPLSIETDLLPLSATPAASTPPKQPVS